MLEMPASLLIIGRILEENHNSIIMKKTSAHNGYPKILFKHMTMVVKTSTDVNTLTAGRNKNTIQKIIKWLPADSKSNVSNPTAHIIIQSRTAANQPPNIIICSQKTEAITRGKPKSINQFS